MAVERSQSENSEATSCLRREVIAPAGNDTGLGVLLVAAAAMFLAVSASAFILRARMTIAACDYAAPAPQSLRARAPVSSEECGTPSYRTNTDGSTTVVYHMCRDSKPLVLSPDSPF